MAAVARAEADWVAEDWAEHPGVEAMVTSAANSAQKVMATVEEKAKVGSRVVEVDRSAEAKMEHPAKVEVETAVVDLDSARPGVVVKVNAGSVVEDEVAVDLVAAATVAKGLEVVGPVPLVSTLPRALFECRTLC